MSEIWRGTKSDGDPTKTKVGLRADKVRNAHLGFVTEVGDQIEEYR